MRLTAAQKVTLAEIQARGYGERWFYPEEVFPARDNRDNAARRTVRNLAKNGLILQRDGQYRLPPIDATI